MKTSNKILLVLISGVLSASLLCTGVILGYRDTFGELPDWFSGSGSLFSINSAVKFETDGNTSLDEIKYFLEKDDTDKDKYEEGYNCVEFSMELARKMNWAGISAVCGRIDLSTGTSHMACIVKDTDGNWVWVEPQTDHIYSSLSIGDEYEGYEVTGLYVLRTEWESW
jgi:hypothetical protein